MDWPFLIFLGAIVLITMLPAWLTGSILKKASKVNGGGGTDWVPLGFVVYGLTEFKHPKKGAIVWAYVFSNILSWGALVTLVVIVLKNRR
jgi:hypothetical protein